MRRYSLILTKTCTAAPPLSSLRLLTPPIRLLSAAMYEVARQRSVKHYGMLEQFVSMVTEAMPQLLTEGQRKLLLFALRAKVTVCDPNCQLDRVPSVSKATGEEEWTSSLESLRRRLIHCPEERQRLLQVVFNDSFDAALQSLLSDLLSRMEQMFPTPDFKQAASWLDGAPGGLDYCLHVAQTRDLRVLLNNRNCVQGKPTTKVSADPEYILLSTMSHPFLTEPTNPEPEQKPANQSESSVQPVKEEEVCDVKALPENEPVTMVTETEQEVVIGQNDEPEESTNESSADCDIIAVTAETDKSKDSPADLTNQSEDRVNQSDASGSDVIVNALDNISHNAKRVAHKCPKCGKCFIYRSQVIRHLRTNKFCSFGLTASGSNKSSDSIGGEEDKARPPEDKTRPQGAHSCFQCGESFSTSADLLSHQPSHQARPIYSCSVCGKHFKHMGSFTSHKLTHLDGEGDEKVCEKERQKEIERERRRERELDRRCTVCEQNFPSQSQLLKHLQTHSVEGETPRYRCRHCELTFTGVTALRIHQRSHSSRAHQCGVCSKTYVSLRGLHSHTETHCTDKRFLCAQCGKRFKTRDGFTGHLRTHSGEKPYSCSYCNKDFTALAGLNVHVRRHTGERPYVCTVCGKGWPSGGDLQKHMRVHTGEKPYVCQECGKAFSISCHLTEHRRIHTGEKPFACPDCGKCLRRKFDLKKHMLSHSGVRPFACSVCSKSYTRNTHLNRHLQTHREGRT